MTNQHELPYKVHPQSLGIRMLQGAGLAFVLIVLFLSLLIFTTDDEVPFLPVLIFPILAVTFGGACGGVFFYLLDFFRQKGTWQTVVANVVWGLFFIPGLYACLIISLKITGHWD